MKEDFIMSNKLIYLVCLVFVLGVAGNAWGDSLIKIDPATIDTGHVYLFNNVIDSNLPDDSANSNTGNILGDPNVVDGLNGQALLLDGVDDGVHLPDALAINTSTHQNHTVIAVFNCADVSKSEKQCVYEEGGSTRGLTIYVHEGLVYAAAWNRADYEPQWNPGTFISAPIESNEWVAVAAVLRGGGPGQEDDKYEMWMDGELIGIGPGAELWSRSDDNAIGNVQGQTIFHDETAEEGGRWFEGMVDEVWILNDPLTEDQLSGMLGGTWPYVYSPDPADGSLHEATWVNLSWKPGDLATSHDVYFGENLDDVVAGAAFVGNTTGTTFGIGALTPGATYYWRIDGVDPDDPNSPWEGPVWSFSLPGLMSADPSPADGSVFVLADEILSWTASINAAAHRVFLGDDLEDVTVGAINVYQGTVLEPSFDPAGLAKGTTYYWRVDELEADGTTAHIGDVWSFSTVPNVSISDPNLIGWWKLDGEYLDLGYVMDYSGYDHYGSLRDDPQLVAGYEGNALDFDGDGDYITIDGYKGILGPNPFSITAWINTSDDEGTIMGWGSTAGGTTRLEFRINGDRLRCESSGNVQGDTSLPDNEWIHVAVTAKEGAIISEPDVTLYLNGQVDNRISTGGTAPLEMAPGYDVTIARRHTSGRWLIALIDEIRLYDKELTAEEIAVDMRIDPLRAYDPSPADRATDQQPTVVLSWMPGDDAVQHNVYLGNDAQAVADAKMSKEIDIFRGTQDLGNESYSAAMELETTYYWRIDEVNADGSVTKGRIWSFTTGDNVLIFDEETAVPYDNTAEPYLSGAELEFDPPWDWSDGLSTLELRYRGQRAGGSVTVDEDAGTYTIVGAGGDIWGTADQFQYAHKTLVGDGSMILKVDNLVHTDPWTKAGIMIRQTLDPDSAFAAVFATGENGVAFQSRAMPGASADSDTPVATDEQKALSAPVWIMLERSFPMINAYYSTDGLTFIPMSWNPQILPMSPSLYIGLAVTSHSGEDVFAEATFSNIMTTGGVAEGAFTSTEIGMPPANSAEPLFVELEDTSGATAIVRNPDPAATQKTDWTDWSFHIGRLDVDLSAIRSVTLGIGDVDNPTPGGTGVITVGSLRWFPNNQPVAQWKLDDGEGTTAGDSSGNGLDGTLNGDPLWVEGMLDGALQLDGVDDYVDCGNPAALDFGTGDFTVSAWINMTAIERGTVYAKGGDNSGGIRYTLAMGEGNDNKMTLTTDDDSTKRQALGATIVNDGNWHHVVGMRYGNTSLVYVDGVLDGSIDLPEGYDLSGTSQANALIGAITDARDATGATLEKFFNGTIDDVHIYDWALSEAEICKIAGL